MLSRPSKYALRAIQELVEIPADEFLPVVDLAEIADVPAPFLSKLMKQLAYSGIVKTRKGVHGGVRLEKRTVSFFEVCEAMQDPIIVETCFLADKMCSKNSPCPFHERWSKERARIHGFLRKSKIGGKE